MKTLEMQSDLQALTFMWLEITGKCQLRCIHCYAESSPEGSEGSMTAQDWQRLLDEAAVLGVTQVQFIGGEPTLHPYLPRFIQHGLSNGMAVEVYSNLVSVPPRLWRVFELSGVSLATSYYSAGQREHESITKRNRSYVRTSSNIREAVQRGVPIRVGLVKVTDTQRVATAVEELRSMGVSTISVDGLRQVGRGHRDRGPTVHELCGACLQGKIAVSPDGDVWPCVFARWMKLGNIHIAGLREIYFGTDSRSFYSELTCAFSQRARAAASGQPGGCDPDQPGGCDPDSDQTPPGGCAPTDICTPDVPKPDCSPDRICKPTGI